MVRDRTSIVEQCILSDDVCGRSGVIRTRDPCVPNAVLYLAELHSEARSYKRHGELPQELPARGKHLGTAEPLPVDPEDLID